MALRNLTSILILSVGIFISGCVTTPAAPDLQNTLESEIQTRTADDGMNVAISVNDGMATLSGYVTDPVARAVAEETALTFDGVDQVENLITVEDDDGMS